MLSFENVGRLEQLRVRDACCELLGGNDYRAVCRAGGRYPFSAGKREDCDLCGQAESGAGRGRGGGDVKRSPRELRSSETDLGAGCGQILLQKSVASFFGR